MFFNKEDNALICKLHRETLRIEGWGKNALRVRSTILRNIPDRRSLSVQSRMVIIHWKKNMARPEKYWKS